MAEMPIVSSREKANGVSKEIRENIAAQKFTGREGGKACHKNKITKNKNFLKKSKTLLSGAQQAQGRM